MHVVTIAMMIIIVNMRGLKMPCSAKHSRKQAGRQAIQHMSKV
jgi:hypothetical protein